MHYVEYTSRVSFISAVLDRLMAVIQKGNHTTPARIALSGGTTPLPIYRALAKQKIDWSSVHFWLVDERFVPIDFATSNYHSIREALGKQAVIHYFDTDQQARATLNHYAKSLPERFDLVILGLGQDGHTASLFPDMKWVEQVDDKIAQIYALSAGEVPDRLTLLPPMIAGADQLLFVVSGAEKKEILKELIGGKKKIPARQFISHPDVEVMYCQ